MKLLKLGQLFKVTSGGTPNKNNLEFFDNGNIPWIKTGDLKTKEIYNASEYITELGVEKSSAKLFPRNTVLIAMYGATIGATSILKIEATTNQACCAFLPCSNVLPEYLYYFFRGNKEKIIAMGVGGAQPNISATILKEIKIPIIDLEKQGEIVKILNKAQELVDKRKEQIEALDELVKSQFIEMFGEEKFPLAKAEEVCEYITKGTTPKSNEIIDEFEEGLVPYLKVYNLSFDGSVLFEDKPQYVTLETHNKFLGRSKVYPNDVLMNIVGPPLGKFAIVPNTFSEWNINQAIAIFRATTKINPLYLLHSLKQPRVLKPFINSAVGVRQQNLSLLQCRNLEIQLAPIELQNQFADFAKQVDKLKFEMQKSLEEMENNFNSLMQRAFKGELFNER